MNVLFLAHSYPRHSGDAAGSFLLLLAQSLADEGVRVTVVVPGARGLAATETVDGIPVRRFRYAPRRWETLAYTGSMATDALRSPAGLLALGGMLAAGRRAASEAVRELSPAVVHAHWWFPAGLVATLGGGAPHVPVVTTAHGSDVRLARRTPGAGALLARVAARSAAVTTVSSWLADEVRIAAPATRPIVAPMPVATALFSPGGGTRSHDRLLFVGRLNEQKGLAHLLHALAIARSFVALDVVGDGTDRTALIELAAHLNLADRVRWLGALPQPALLERYRAAAAVIVPSTDEGLGLVPVEALLCETPVVAFRSGGLVDVIDDGRTGLLVPPGEPPALAAAIDGLLARDDRGAALARAGRLHALATFSPSAVARRYRAIYEDAAARGARS